jgi:N6-adenosine-specific RNA methylase IME4
VFEVLLVDPPWKFRNEKTGGSHKSGASQKYKCLDLGIIQTLPVGSIAAHSAVLGLWCPTRLKFSHGYPTAVAWGFSQYETTIYWEKPDLGMGFWVRNVVEELLICTRGDVAPFGLQERNILHLPAGEHSEKPEEFRHMLERATGKISRRRCVELFARKLVPGWTGIGDKVTGRDIRMDLRLLAAGSWTPAISPPAAGAGSKSAALS